MAERYIRSCPEHLTEIVFRPMPSPNGGAAIAETPWCVGNESRESHVCEGWLVQAQDGDVVAVATLSKYEPYFDVDALFEEWLSGDARRQLAVPYSEMTTVGA